MTSVPRQGPPQKVQPKVEPGLSPTRPALSGGVVAVGFGLLCVSYMLNAMDRQIFYPLLPDISEEFGFSLEQGGTLATGFTLGLALAGLVGGFLADRLSRRNILVIAVLTYSAGTLGVPLASGFVDMSAYRLLSGVGEGIHAAALYAVVGAFFFHRRAVAAGVVGVSFGLGIFLGPLVGTQIVAAWGDWRGPFYVFAAAGVVMALLIVAVVSKRLTEAVTGRAAHAAETYEHVPASPLNRNTVGLGVACVVSGLVFYGFLGLYPTFLGEELGFSDGQAAFALSMAGFGAMMAAMTSGCCSAWGSSVPPRAPTSPTRSRPPRPRTTCSPSSSARSRAASCSPTAPQRCSGPCDPSTSGAVPGCSCSPTTSAPRSRACCSPGWWVRWGGTVPGCGS